MRYGLPADFKYYYALKLRILDFTKPRMRLVIVTY